MDQVTAFRHSLAETIAWCTAHAAPSDPEHCLRTPALRPGPLEHTQSLAERQACVSTLIQARSQLLQDAGVSPQTLATDLAGGRLLLFEPDETLSDGGAAVCSRRFFDDDNVPPWDCWVLYVSDPCSLEERMYDEARGRRLGRWSHEPPSPPTLFRPYGPPWYWVDPPRSSSYLVGWVPPSLVPLAHTGVLGNPECCIEWLADRETPFTQVLDELHLLV
jgi:hypothetical protein